MVRGGSRVRVWLLGSLSGADLDPGGDAKQHSSGAGDLSYCKVDHVWRSVWREGV